MFNLLILQKDTFFVEPFWKFTQIILLLSGIYSKINLL